MHGPQPNLLYSPFMPARSLYSRYYKSISSRVLAGVILLPAAGLVLLAALPLLISNKGKLFFRQTRIGRGGKPFVILKLRTMRPAEPGEQVPHDEEARLHSVGKWVRRLHIDELPQLIHVLKGEMRFIGPRPLLPEYLPRYTKEESRRHEVVPGLTGFAQIKGGNALDWDTRLALDVEYVKRESALLDAFILYKTLLHLAGRVASRNGSPTISDGLPEVR